MVAFVKLKPNSLAVPPAFAEAEIITADVVVGLYVTQPAGIVAPLKFSIKLYELEIVPPVATNGKTVSTQTEADVGAIVTVVGNGFTVTAKVAVLLHVPSEAVKVYVVETDGLNIQPVISSPETLVGEGDQV